MHLETTFVDVDTGKEVTYSFDEARLNDLILHAHSLATDIDLYGHHDVGGRVVNGSVSKAKHIIAIIKGAEDQC